MEADGLIAMAEVVLGTRKDAGQVPLPFKAAALAFGLKVEEVKGGQAIDRGIQMEVREHTGRTLGGPLFLEILCISSACMCGSCVW